jgi:hypothetical protein
MRLFFVTWMYFFWIPAAVPMRQADCHAWNASSLHELRDVDANYGPHLVCSDLIGQYFDSLNHQKVL